MRAWSSWVVSVSHISCTSQLNHTRVARLCHNLELEFQNSSYQCIYGAYIFVPSQTLHNAWESHYLFSKCYLFSEEPCLLYANGEHLANFPPVLSWLTFSITSHTQEKLKGYRHSLEIIVYASPGTRSNSSLYSSLVLQTLCLYPDPHPPHTYTYTLTLTHTPSHTHTHTHTHAEQKQNTLTTLY